MPTFLALCQGVIQFSFLFLDADQELSGGACTQTSELLDQMEVQLENKICTGVFHQDPLAVDFAPNHIWMCGSRSIRFSMSRRLECWYDTFS